MKVYCIIVTYNALTWIDKCFSSIRNSSIPFKTIVVDNGSTDNTVQIIKTLYPEVHIIQSGKNLGFGKANNIGFRMALDDGCDYVYLLNQDGWIEPNTLENLIKVHKSHPNYGILSPIQVTAKKVKMDKNFELSACPQFCPNFLSDLYFGSVRSVYPIRDVMAAHWLISRQCLETVGGFSPVFPHYGEDNNYIHRALYHGFKVGICPEARGVHDREYREESRSKIIYRKYIQTLVSASAPGKRKCLRFMKDSLYLFIFTVTKFESIRDFKYLFKPIPVLKAFYQANKSKRKGVYLFSK